MSDQQDRIKTWTHEGDTYRFIGRFDKEREYGYVGLFQNRYNVLQKKTFFGWRDIEKESVPNHIYYEQATMGSTDWKSKLLQKCKDQCSYPEGSVSF